MERTVKHKFLLWAEALLAIFSCCDWIGHFSLTVGTSSQSPVEGSKTRTIWVALIVFNRGKGHKVGWTIKQNGCEKNWVLNSIKDRSTLCYTHRSMSSSAIISKASSCSSWENTENHGQTLCREWETFQYSPVFGCLHIFIKSLSSELRKPLGRGGRNMVRDRVHGGHQENKTF